MNIEMEMFIMFLAGLILGGTTAALWVVLIMRRLHREQLKRLFSSFYEESQHGSSDKT